MSLTITEINASGLYYRELNEQIRQAVIDGARKIVLRNVTGQRYIGTNLHSSVDREALKGLEIEIFGTPGNDLGMFLDGPSITVHGNVMDGSGNTMNCGRIIAHGRAGDITGFSSRSGEIFIRDNAGYRLGIHMKEYGDMRPVILIGGTTQDFLGEYMAGGVIIILGKTLKLGEAHRCSHVGTGMHGGRIMIRGEMPIDQLGGGVGEFEPNEEDIALLEKYIAQYGAIFSEDMSDITPNQFIRLSPLSARPYKQLYAY